MKVDFVSVNTIRNQLYNLWLRQCGTFDPSHLQSDRSVLHIYFYRSDWPSARAYPDDPSQNEIRIEGANANVSILIDRVGLPQVQFSPSTLKISNCSVFVLTVALLRVQPLSSQHLVLTSSPHLNISSFHLLNIYRSHHNISWSITLSSHYSIIAPSPHSIVPSYHHLIV